MTSLLPPNAHATAVLVLAFLAFVGFSRDRIPLQTTSLAVLVALVIGFETFAFYSGGERVGATEFFQGFGHQALVAIVALMVLGRGLVLTGALQPASQFLARLFDRSAKLALLTVLVFCALSSSVLNDTPVVLLMMPVLVGAALKSGRSPSETLLPMNYAVLMGGMTTTIGTSTNLLVVSIAADLGVRKFGVFDFAHVAVIASFFGIAYLWLVLPYLLPKRQAPIEELKTQIFEAILYIQEDSDVVGKTLADIRKKAGRSLEIHKVLRASGTEVVKLPSLELMAGDRIYTRASADDLNEFSKKLDAALHNLDESESIVDEENPLKPSEMRLADVVVAMGSILDGQTLRSTRFAERFDVIVVGLYRPSGSSMIGNEDITDRTVRAGDILLVKGSSASLNRLKKAAGLLVLDQRYEVPRTDRAPIALVILAAVVMAAALKFAPIHVAAVSGVLAMIVTRCIDWTEVGSAVSDKIILLVVASLALGAALTRTGGTDYLAGLILHGAQGASPTTVLVLLMAFMAAVTNFVSNSAAAAIGTPIAVSLAQRLNLSPEPLVLAILFGANFCYVTPMAYQTNLLVMSAGGYSFADFVRCGFPLALLMLAIFAVLIPHFFPF